MSSLIGCCNLAAVVEYSPFAAEKCPGLHTTETVRLIRSTDMENTGFSQQPKTEGWGLVPSYLKTKLFYLYYGNKPMASS